MESKRNDILRYRFSYQCCLLSALTVFLIGFGVQRIAEAAPPQCNNTAVALTYDYASMIGSADYSDPDGDPEATAGLDAVQIGRPSTVRSGRRVVSTGPEWRYQ